MNSQFWKLWTALAISNVGDGIATTAMPLLAVTLTRDPALVAGITVATRLPWLLFSLPAGALVDRLDRRWMMVITDAFRTILLLTLSVLIWKNWINLPLLYLVIFLFGIAEVLFDTAAQTILPAVVPKKYLNAANGYLMAAITVGNEFAGPALGSLLFSLSVTLPFVTQTSGLAMATILVYALQGQFQDKKSADESQTSLGNEIFQGFRWLIANPLLRNLAAITGIINLLEMSVLSIFVLYALEVLGVSKLGYGVMLTCGAIGGLLASVLVNQIIKLIGSGTCLFLSMLLGSISTVVMILVPNVYVVAAMLALISFVGVIWNIITVSLRQTIVPNNLLGRVNSIYRLLSWGSIPLGALLGGFLARYFGLSVPFWVNTIVISSLAFIVLPFLNNKSISDASK